MTPGNPALKRAFLFVALSILASCASIYSARTPRPSPAGLDQEINALRRRHDIPGLGVALIREGSVVYLRTFGTRDAARLQPLTPDTLMYGASLTKAAFAVYVMQLVDEGRIDLDRPIADDLPAPLPSYPRYADLAGDDRWRRLTIRNLLDHTSGFANFRWLEPDGKLRLHRDPGERYGYSGEGIELVQFIIEQRFGLDVGDEMQRHVFDRFGMRRTSMTWRDDFGDDVADGHSADGTALSHRRRRRPDAAGSMDTTLRDTAALVAGLVRGEGLSPEAKREMIRRQVVIDSLTQFPTLSESRTDANARLGLGYGLGWGVFDTPHGPAFFKEGHDDGTANYAMCIDAERACVVLMANTDRAEGIFNALVERSMGVEMPWRWEGYVPFD